MFEMRSVCECVLHVVNGRRVRDLNIATECLVGCCVSYVAASNETTITGKKIYARQTHDSRLTKRSEKVMAKYAIIRNVARTDVFAERTNEHAAQTRDRYGWHWQRDRL